MKLGLVIWGVQTLLSGASLALRRPWTMLLSRRRYPRALWDTPLFVETNMIITGAWTAYFAIAAAASAVGPAAVPIGFAIASAPLAKLSFWFGDRYSSARLARPS